jgi:curli biogenesis system outer membrane secretion channel CsgG
MRRRSLLSLAAAAGLVLVVAGTAGAQDRRPGVGVLPFDNGGSYGADAEDYEALSVGVQQMLMTEFTQNAGLRVVERSRIKQLIEEQDLGASGRVDAQTAARLGKLVGARYMISGSFMDNHGNMRLDIRVVNTETSEIVRADKVEFKRDDLFQGIVSAAQKITQGLQLPGLAQAAQQQREDHARAAPPEAVKLYTRGLLYADRGDNERARELFSRAKELFPEYTEADVALKQISG